MSREKEMGMRDIVKASVVISDRIGRDVSAQLDLEEALEASTYTSHPYSTHPREVNDDQKFSVGAFFIVWFMVIGMVLWNTIE
ncbi:hypothetical protein E3N88_44366 [Mikania micrantha]|uniref:Uncharacterized protein n=1 Tax=Mikania micrantha TaxID=192012 RepID=A0A5N6LC83_9ASTR|nr:hypothetical protein E3N88_44366 [Mikania micrantha]